MLLSVISAKAGIQNLLQFLLVGFVAGWVLGRIVRGKGYGLIRNILIGGLGAIIGGYLFGFLGVSLDNTLGAIVMAIVGAIVLFLFFNLLKSLRHSDDDEEAEK